jgi:hypothetical protein
MVANCRSLVALGMTVLGVACGHDATAPTTPKIPPGTVPGGVPGVYQGFDISVYPGDAAMLAWQYPLSPYRWAGYYLPAPCHRDGTWSGKYATLTAMGWGTTVVYVGQQDWTQIPTAPASPNRAVDRETKLGAAANVAPGSAASLVTCSASLLSTDQGLIEAADAVAIMRANGFPDRSVVFLDIEFVTSVTPALLAYYTAWIRGVLADGHFEPGVYAARANATTLHDAAADVYRVAGRAGAPAFWIASSVGFSTDSLPTASGFSYAKVWQGMFEVTRSYHSVTLQIDVNVAGVRSPSAPPSP